MLYCVYCNLRVGDNYIISMVIIDILIYEIDVLCWLLDDDYVLVQVVFLCKVKYVKIYLRDL